jgi:hypothetical protein
MFFVRVIESRILNPPHSFFYWIFLKNFFSKHFFCLCPPQYVCSAGDSKSRHYGVGVAPPHNFWILSGFFSLLFFFSMFCGWQRVATLWCGSSSTGTMSTLRRNLTSRSTCMPEAAKSTTPQVSIRQYTSVYVSIRQHRSYRAPRVCRRPQSLLPQSLLRI